MARAINQLISYRFSENQRPKWPNGAHRGFCGLTRRGQRNRTARQLALDAPGVQSQVWCPSHVPSASCRGIEPRWPVLETSPIPDRGSSSARHPPLDDPPQAGPGLNRRLRAGGVGGNRTLVSAMRTQRLPPGRRPRVPVSRRDLSAAAAPGKQVDRVGIEPTASCLQGISAPQCAALGAGLSRGQLSAALACGFRQGGRSRTCVSLVPGQEINR